MAVGASSFTVKVTDANSIATTQGLSIAINPTVTVTTASLPSAMMNSSYGVSLAASGGQAPYTWSLVSSSGSLPAGLQLNSNGSIGGMPTTTGSSSFTVQVSDANADTALRPLTLAVNPALTISSPPFPGADQYLPYSLTLQASGGQPPYVWSVSSNALPTGLSLAASTGAITGTPTYFGTTSFTLKVTDANQRSASLSTSIVVFETDGCSTQ
jgi:hypothetical protein